MCGRYYVDEETSEMRELLAGLEERFKGGEIFPTNLAPVIRRDGVALLKWGFPRWNSTGVIINARAETAFEKSMFRKSILERRCVIPCSGFYEWRQSDGKSDADGQADGRSGISEQADGRSRAARSGGKKKKDRYRLTRPGSPLYLAGMFGVFTDPDGYEYESFVILTTAANQSVAPIHNRMPVIVGAGECEAWLGDLTFAEFAMTRTGPVLQLGPS